MRPKGLRALPALESASSRRLFLLPSEPVPVRLQQRHAASGVIICSVCAKRKEEIKVGDEELFGEGGTGKGCERCRDSGRSMPSAPPAAEQVAVSPASHGEGGMQDGDD